jgi:hypothetical protein
MTPVRLSNGQTALIDDEDFPLVRPYLWHASRGGRCVYALARVGKQTLKMHRVILAAPLGVQVDHANGNGLDNRRCNIRLATASQNAANRRCGRGRSSYQGVYFSQGKWRATIGYHRKRIDLGRFKAEADAARAYDRAALELFGGFATLNFAQP